MGTMIDYLREYGDYTFSEKPLNEVDSLILSQFAYLKFDGLVPEAGSDAPAVTMEELDAHRDRDKLFADERYREPNTELFEGLKRNRKCSLQPLCFSWMTEWCILPTAVRTRAS